MSRIKSGEVSMRPRRFFIWLKAGLVSLGISLAIMALFFLNMVFYLPRRNGCNGFGSSRIVNILATVPWGYLVLGIFGITALVFILWKYTGVYKKRLSLLVGVVAAALIIGAYAVSYSNLNKKFESQRGMGHFYGRNTQTNGGLPNSGGPGMGRGNHGNCPLAK